MNPPHLPSPVPLKSDLGTPGLLVFSYFGLLNPSPQAFDLYSHPPPFAF
jgi:hypothetical protein